VKQGVCRAFVYICNMTHNMVMTLLLCIMLNVIFGISITETVDNCHDSDVKLEYRLDVLKSSLGVPTRTNATGLEDWPNQAIYMHDLLQTLIDPQTCLNTQLAQETIDFLDSEVTESVWWQTWEVFQVSYYDMPAKNGTRVESPATLGRKCWAFAYLAEIWPDLKPVLIQTMKQAGRDIMPFSNEYDRAVSMTMPLCNQVLANCFVNATYNPELRNGTCPGSVREFYIGYQWENGNNHEQWRNDSITYPFHVYHMTQQFEQDVTFAVNTVLNYII